jgi:putative MATE family efflux protein
MSQINHTNKVSQYISIIKKSLLGGEHDYTQGSIRIAIVLLAIPMILELSLESVFAVVDIYFVGKLGSNATQTVGLTESVITLVYSLAIGLSMAATAMVARRVGEKDPEAASHAGMQALIMSLIATVFISAAGLIFAPDILRIMGATPEVVSEGTVFTRIMLGGSVVIILLFLINGIFRGAGNAAMAMRSLWIASLINIFLCPALINGWGPLPALGLKGAAIATVIGRGTGVLYQCYHLFWSKKHTISFSKEHFKIDFPLMKSLVKLAWPATFQFIIASGSWIVLAQLVAVTGGPHASAGYQIAIRNLVFFILPAWGLSNAAATLVGQNLGAKEPGRAEKSVMLTTKYNAIFMSGVMILFVFFAKPLVGIFTHVPEDLKFGAQALQIMGTGFIFYGIGMVMIQSLNGAGDTKTPTRINLFCFWLFQVPLAYLLVKVFKTGVIGVFIVIPVAETALACAAYYYFRKGKWKEIKV